MAKVPVPSMSTLTSKLQNVPAGKVACNPIGNVPRSGAGATAALTKTSAATEANALAANVRIYLIVLSLLFIGCRCASASAALLGQVARRRSSSLTPASRCSDRDRDTSASTPDEEEGENY